MTAPETPVETVRECVAVSTGTTDADDLAAILDDDAKIVALRLDVEAHRQAIVARHGIDAIAPVMLSLSRLSGLAQQLAGVTEAMDVEARFIRNYLTPSPPRGAA